MAQILISLAGKDRPGITNSVLSVLSKSNAEILDVEQSVIHDQLSITFLADIMEARNEKGVFDSVLLPLHQAADRFGLAIRVVPFRQNRFIQRSRRNTYAITVLGDVIAAEDLAVVTKLMLDMSLNIEKIHTLTEVGFHSVEFIVYSKDRMLDETAIKHQLLPAVQEMQIDIAVQRESLFRRNKRLLVMDVDSTLIQGEIIDELAREAGVQDAVSEITERAMAGDLDFEQALRERVRLLKGLSTDRLAAVAASMELNPGAEELISKLQKLGYRVAIISGGFQFFTSRLRERLGLDYSFANELECVDEILTGELVGEIVDREKKAEIVRQLCHDLHVDRDQVVAVGDGANDILMLEAAGLGIGFHPKAVLREQADVSVTAGGLNRILYLLGMDDASHFGLQDPEESS